MGRAERRHPTQRVKQILNYTEGGEKLKATTEMSDPWSMDKDGKRWFDTKEYPGILRK
jgi:hypothetical protein